MKEVEILDLISEYVYNQDLDGLKTALDKWKGLDIAKYNRSELTLLHVAAKVKNSAPIIEFLIDRGIAVDVLAREGRTPLLDAVLYKCPNNLKTLIRLGGDVNVQDIEKRTPLVTACCHTEDDFACVKILLEHGALINVSSKDHLGSRTALEAAVYNAEDIALITYLIEQGADVNLEAPLMKAISIENLEMIQLLVQKGATVNQYENKNGENDLAFAKRVGNKEIIAYLEQQI